MEIRPIRKIQNLKIRAYCPDGTYIGMIKDEIQLMDFQIQVKKEGKEGYYITYQRHKYSLKSDGRIPDFHLLEEVTIDKQLMELVGF